MKRRTWAILVFGAATVGIVLAVVTNHFFRSPSDKSIPDPNAAAVKKLKEEFEEHKSKPSPESIKEMQRLAALDPEMKQTIAALQFSWLHRMNEERIAQNTPEFRELALLHLANDPDAPKTAVVGLRNVKGRTDRPFWLNLLTQYGNAAIPAMMTALEEDARKAGPDYLIAATSPFPKGVADLGLEALPKVCKDVNHEESAVRRQALRTLALMARGVGSERTVDALPEIDKALSDNDRSVRAFAALAWGELARPESSTEAIKKALDNSDSIVRLAAARVLANRSGIDKKRLKSFVEPLLKADNFTEIWWGVADSRVRLEELAVWKSGGTVKYDPLFWEELAAHVLLDLGAQNRLEPIRIVDLLRNCPHDGRHLIGLLAAHGDRAAPAVPLLVAMLKGDDKLQRRKALLALGRLGIVALEALPDMEAALLDEHGPTRWQAFLALVRLDPAAAKNKLPATLDSAILKMTVPAVRFGGSKWTDCEWQGSAAVLVPVTDVDPALDADGVFRTPIDRDIDAENKRIDSMLDELARSGSLGKKAVPFLLSVWQGTERPKIIDARHGQKALSILVHQGSDAEEAVPHLLQAWPYYDTIEPDKPIIKDALVQIGPVSVPYLVKLLDGKGPSRDLVLAMDSEKKRRFYLCVFDVLQKFGPKSKAAVPAIVRTIDGSDEEIAMAAVATLGALGATANDAVPELRKKLQDKNTSVRRHAADALGLLGPAAKAALPDLIALFEDTQELHVVATRAVSKIGKDAVEPLTKALADPREKVRLGAVEALIRMPPSDARPALAAAQKLTGPDQPESIRLEAQKLVKSLEAK